MPDLEKVIKALECCILHDPDDHRKCVKCPYHHDGISNSPCDNGLKCDALSLLKAQEPRVMTPEEVAAVPEGGVIWEEIRRTGICEARIRHGNCFIDCADYLELDEVTDCDDYLKHYRCWASRPTDEQRKAVKWDEPPKEE